MKVWIVWDNDDFGSTLSPSHDYIDNIYIESERAFARAAALNKGRSQHRSKARVEGKDLVK